MPINHHNVVKAIWFDVRLDFKMLAASQLAAKALASGLAVYSKHRAACAAPLELDWPRAAPLPL